MSDSESDHEDEKELDLSNSAVVTKYKSSADITNSALAAVIAAAKPGVKISELCAKGDSVILEATSKVFKGKSIEKGIAFPTCVSVNNCVGHYSPPGDDATELQEGDLVKIDLGTHIDGWIATAAHSLVAQADPAAPVSGKAASVLQAASTALEVAMRLVRPGKKLSQVSGPVNQVVEAYGGTLVEGVESFALKRFVIDSATKRVVMKPRPEDKPEDAEFEENEVYAIDLVVSTGGGKVRVLDERSTNVFKRNLEEDKYHPRIKAARSLFAEVNKRFPTTPFALRHLESAPGQVRLGLTECLSHGLLTPYPVYYEKAGELVAQFKATVLLMPNGSDRITSAPLQTLEPEQPVELPEEVQALLKTSLKTKAKKAKKKDKKGGQEGDAAATGGNAAGEQPASAQANAQPAQAGQQAADEPAAAMAEPAAAGKAAAPKAAEADDLHQRRHI